MFWGFGADPTDSALDVDELDGEVVTVRTKAVVEDIGGDAETIEPAGDLDAFMVGSEAAVAAARANDEGGTGGVFFRSRPSEEEGLVFVFGAFGARGALGPEEDFFGFGGVEGGGD